MAPRYPSLEGMEIAIPPYDHRDSGFGMAETERTATAEEYDTRHRSVIKARKVMGCEVDIHDARSEARIPSEPSRVQFQNEDARPRMDAGERRFSDKRAAREYHRFATSLVDERLPKPNSTPSHVQKASSPGRALVTHSDGGPRPRTSWGPERPLSAFESDSEDEETARLMASIRGFFCNGAKCVGIDEETGGRGGRSLFGKAREWHSERTKARRREEMKRTIRTSHGE
ncbi:uncharacterized protein J7T54_001653 [Emericellopsis cladophorae]|uniref:Uncharacterized protein n=1 Tax=Emericellopsis cladophorae TaxID=2686198 RepID=A0A9P9Y5A7_9HYPO|nr:uncharacterized protein J7T54_001653 [Emericellopsis cladophorae]KAI6783777.1 hypothetical protein J7T54_001653 [Emericellopsis cladophorae]